MDLEGRKNSRQIIWIIIASLILVFCTILHYMMGVGNLITIYKMINVLIPIPSECVITDMTVFAVAFVGGIPIVVLLFLITQRKSSVLYSIFFGIQLIFIIGILTTLFIIAPRYPNYEYFGACAIRPFSRISLLLISSGINIVLSGVFLGARLYKNYQLKKNISKPHEK